MVRRAQLDPSLAVRIVEARALRYTTPAAAHEDRPAHVRAASGLAVHQGRLMVVQDDAQFLAVVTDHDVTAVKLPRGRDGRRRFEVALGNKLDKLDLESCVVIDDDLWAFGSGSRPEREQICIVDGGAARVRDAAPLYRMLRDAVGSDLNLEGCARIGDELWLFHRGNTGPADVGPAVARLRLADVRAWLTAVARVPEHVIVERYDLGTIDGQRLGFTDAVAHDGRVFYLAAAEASPDAVADGPVLGSQLGVIDAEVRATALVGPRGEPIKAEGLAFDGAHTGGLRAWIALDPDDAERPSTLLAADLIGPW